MAFLSAGYRASHSNRIYNRQIGKLQNNTDKYISLGDDAEENTLWCVKWLSVRQRDTFLDAGVLQLAWTAVGKVRCEINTLNKCPGEGECKANRATLILGLAESIKAELKSRSNHLAAKISLIKTIFIYISFIHVLELNLPLQVLS